MPRYQGILLLDRVSADLLPVDLSASRVPQDGSEGGAADVLGHLDDVAERVLGQPVGGGASDGAHDVLPVPVEMWNVILLTALFNVQSFN